jgi:fluoroacetyl-CoA thioesterase
MKTSPGIGTTGEIVFRVTGEHTIDFADDGMPEILCTPWLIWFLEHAAREAVLPYLEQGESTVGVHIEVDHLAATPVGQQVVCQARIVQREAKQFWFRLEAFDELELIATGLHQLQVINVERFAKRVNQKMD